MNTEVQRGQYWHVSLVQAQSGYTCLSEGEEHEEERGGAEHEEQSKETENEEQTKGVGLIPVTVSLALEMCGPHTTR